MLVNYAGRRQTIASCLLLRFDEKVKRFAINILHSERRDDERRPRVTGLVPVVGYDLVVPEVRGINRRERRRTLDWYLVSDCVECGNRRRRLASKLPSAETHTCQARVRVYSPPLSMLHGYVNDRMWRHGVSGDLLGSSLSGSRNVGRHRTSCCRYL